MNQIFPTPKNAKFDGSLVTVGRLTQAGFSLVVQGKGEMVDTAVEQLQLELNDRFAITPPYAGDFTITLKVPTRSKKLLAAGDEAYSIKITEEGAMLECASERSAYYAVITLVSLMELHGEAVKLPVGSILDYPHFPKRGVFAESRFNDFMTLDDWKRVVDDFAKLKMNKLELSVYGCWSVQYEGIPTQHQYIPFKCLPEFKRAKPRKYYSAKKGGFVNLPETLPNMYTEDFLGDIISYAKKRNVEVIPLFNSYGHNNLLPSVVPEISAIGADGKPTNSGFCLSNPKTYEILFKLYDEIIDRYLAPNGITSICVGLDEVGENAFCKCPKCATKENKDHFTDHVIKILKYLKGRGMKEIYIYYDMYFYIFKNLNEELAERFKAEGVYDVTVMDWWNYGASVDFFRGRANEVNGSFKKSIIKPMSGYFSWQVWADNSANIAYATAKALEHNFEGMISYAAYEPSFDSQYAFLAESCWNPDPDPESSPRRFFKDYFKKNYPDNWSEAEAAWEIARHRMHPYAYAEKLPSRADLTQYPYSYKRGDMEYPRNNISEMLGKIIADPKRYVPYLNDLKSRMQTALDFFTSDKAAPGSINDNIVTTLAETYSYADEFLNLYRIYEQSAEGALTNGEMRETVKALIRKRKAQMLRVENSRMESLNHQMLRMMTTHLEFLWQMLEKIDEADREGKLYVFDPATAIDRTAPVFSFLR